MTCEMCGIPLNTIREVYGPIGTTLCGICYLTDAEDRICKCQTCKGEKTVKCKLCLGGGSCCCSECDDEHDCRRCRGEGVVDCPTCKGAGKQARLMEVAA